MNILDLVESNPFLKSLYPNGITGDLLIGDVTFGSGGHIGLTIHTKEKPCVETKKWGVWGKDYNVVSIKLNACNPGDVVVSNWYCADFMPASIEKGEESLFVFSQESGSFSFKLNVEFFSFQGCSAYLIG
ncbi:hypothetical protein [Pantoea cypripedii]|uniref:hypothetical protein n=1 Tax=Pantoea cypripedii TaxID=55209 RepID=UPI00111C0068|nr:hypothetical protein [Pantoea cypripedii]MBP2194594.1 hypothetical protein [Pantoea cypripedii]